MVRPPLGDTLLIVKAAAATVIAWVVADRVMGSATPYYAPLAALLVVERTIVRSVGESVRRLVAVGLGMGLAWVVGTVLGLHWWSMGLVIIGALVIGRWPRLRESGLQVPSMALLSLLTAGGTNEDFTALTMLETLVGGVIGVVVNVLVFAPLHLQGPRQEVIDFVGRVRALLDEVADGLCGTWDGETVDGWRERSDALHEEASAVHEQIEFGRESQRLNPRQVQQARPAWDGYRESVEGLRRVTWHVGGLARTVREDLDDERTPCPSPQFLAGIAEVLRSISATFDDFGGEEPTSAEAVGAHLDEAVDQLDDLARRLQETPLDDPRAWPVHGALLHDCRRLVDEVRLRAAAAVVPAG